MNDLVYNLIKNIKSDDEGLRGNAITDISLVLEMNTKKLSRNEREARYEGLINSELLNIDLLDLDQIEMTKILKDEVIRSNKSTLNLLFAIGFASAKAGLMPLLEIINNHSLDFDENMSFQALISLERLLFFERGELSEEEKANIISCSNPISFIENKAVLSDRLGETAERLLDGLNKMV